MSIVKNIVSAIVDYLGESNFTDTFLGMFPSNHQLSEMGYVLKPTFAWLPNKPYNPVPHFNSVQVVPAKVELHEAKQAGTHLDFRFVIKGEVYDYAVVRKDHFPTETGKLYRLVRTPHHSLKYFNTDKRTFVPGEYGEGEMKTVWRGNIDIIESTKGLIEFYVPEGDFKGRYAIRDFTLPSGETAPMLLRMKDPILFLKERQKFEDNDKKLALAYEDPNIIAEHKEDGANYTLVLRDKENVLISRRPDVEGNPINQADKMPQLKYWKGPIEFRNRNIHVEIVDGNNVSTTAGLLNSLPGKSRRDQMDGNSLVAKAWDIEAAGPYAERRGLYKVLCKRSPRVDNRFQGDQRDQFLSRRLTNPRLLSAVQSNQDLGLSPKEYTAYLKGAGQEGAVLKRLDGPNSLYKADVWLKDKKSETFTLPIVGFTEGKGEDLGRVGAIIVKNANGVESKVGSGWDDRTGKLLWEYQSLAINKKRPIYIEVDCHNLTSRGVMRGARMTRFTDENDFANRVRSKETVVAMRKRAAGLRK